MSVEPTASELRRFFGRAAIATIFAASGACGPATVVGADSGSNGNWESVPTASVNGVDLIVLVDNSNSMRENQTNLMTQLGGLVDALTNPPCASASNPSPHACAAGDPMDAPIRQPVRDLHVGVVSSDLGTPGSSVPGCANSDLGDDGMLNPIRNGQALARHEPWTSAPPTYGRPADCTDPNQFPSFITFTSGTTDPATFTHDFQCNMGIYCNGCGLESQLDSIYRALVIHDAREVANNTSPNAGFLRENAILAILMLTDEEDGSVRDCRFANGTPCDGTGAIDVYNPASTEWSNMELNLRFYMAQPCGPQDPTWPLERYVDPANPTAGLLALKPGHPERFVFGAITGVPLAVPMTGTGPDARIDWDRLLGAPGARGPEDFCGRDSSMLANMTSAEGPISMAQAHADPNCPQRVVPACRREGSTYTDTACTADVQYFAWPGRRIVEVARRFDQSPVCNGAPCESGFVASICNRDYASAMDQMVTRIGRRLVSRCLARTPTMTQAEGLVTVQCRMTEVAPEGVDACDATRGLVDPVGPNGTRAPAYTTLFGVSRRVCELTQVPTDAISHQPVAGTMGWYFDVTPEPSEPWCVRHVSFVPGSEPVSGATAGLECLQ